MAVAGGSGLRPRIGRLFGRGGACHDPQEVGPAIFCYGRSVCTVYVPIPVSIAREAITQHMTKRPTADGSSQDVVLRYPALNVRRTQLLRGALPRLGLVVGWALRRKGGRGRAASMAKAKRVVPRHTHAAASCTSSAA